MAHILITGATGYAGRVVLNTALADPDVAKVTVLVRRELPSDADRRNEDKISTVLVDDFSALDWDDLAKSWWWPTLTGVAWVLGSPIHKTSLELPEYEKMTIDWPVACCSRIPRNANFVFVTGKGVTRDGNAWGPGAVTRNVKGRAESQLLALWNSAGKVVIARPGGITESTFLTNLLPPLVITPDTLAIFVVESAKKGKINGKDTWESGEIVKYVHSIE